MLLSGFAWTVFAGSPTVGGKYRPVPLSFFSVIMKKPLHCLNCNTSHTCVLCVCGLYFPLAHIVKHREKCIPTGLGIGTKDISRINSEYIIKHIIDMVLYMCYIKNSI